MEVEFEYNTEKNAKLLEERGIGFDTIIHYMNNGYLLDIVHHYNNKRYGHQYIYVVDVEGYIYLVPFVEKEGNKVFLKTIFPSRKHTKQYLAQRSKSGGKDHVKKAH